MTKIIPLKPFGKDLSSSNSSSDALENRVDTQSKSDQSQGAPVVQSPIQGSISTEPLYSTFKIHEISPHVHLDGVYWSGKYWSVWVHPNFLAGAKNTFSEWQQVNNRLLGERLLRNSMPHFGVVQADFYHAIFRTVWEQKNNVEHKENIEKVRKKLCEPIRNRGICMLSYAEINKHIEFLAHAYLQPSLAPQGRLQLYRDVTGIDLTLGSDSNASWLNFMLGDDSPPSKIELMYKWLLGLSHVTLKKVPESSGDGQWFFTIRGVVDQGLVGTYNEFNEKFSAIGVYARDAAGREYP